MSGNQIKGVVSMEKFVEELEKYEFIGAVACITELLYYATHEE
jgi:hypothetical protein